MYKSGLFIITKGLTEKNLKIVYNFAKSHVCSRLYLSVKGFSPWNGDWRSNIQICYNSANKFCPDLDVRLILPHIENHLSANKNISVILCDDKTINKDKIHPLISYTTNTIPDVLLHVEGDKSYQESHNSQNASYHPVYNSVVLGGTFDHLHNGHKILLSHAALLSDNRLFCGVSDEELLKDKVLFDLIEPLDQRIHNCIQFLRDIKPGIDYTVEAINHPNGPTTEINHFQCIVASSETEKGCGKINKDRQSKGLSKLDIELISMMDEEIDNRFAEITEETKVSSTRNRLKLLGKLLKPPTKAYSVSQPYVIGLTGGIASGKSSIAKKLGILGAEIIDCDKLGHEAYLNGTGCYRQLVAEFSDSIVNKSNNQIDRPALGAIVFREPERMKKLTGIVWPIIAQMAQQRINSCNKKVVIIDAAVLLDAGWEKMCNEIWVSFIPRSEAVKRIQERNKLTEEQAIRRISSQKENKVYINAAHVIFCSLWSYECTQTQIDEAWSSLELRMKI